MTTNNTSTGPHPATVTVVTGPPGVDIGPAVAWLGRDIGDGLAIRTVVSGHGTADSPAREGAHCHSALIPGPIPAPHGVPERYAPLWVLPSVALSAPDANLGIAYTGAATRDLLFDLNTLGQATGAVHGGASHRLTVQFPSWDAPGPALAGMAAASVPPAVEVGDLAIAARDSVLRAAGSASRQVLVEAGDGQTFLDALHTVGLAPWSPHIDRLQLRLVLNAADVADNHRPADGLAAMASREVIRQGCGYLSGWAPGRIIESLSQFAVILENFHTLVPEIAGMGRAGLLAEPERGGPIPQPVADQIGELIAGFERRTGANVCALGTGPDADGRCQYIDVTM